MHSFRVPHDIWSRAARRAKREGTNVTAVIVAALRRYGDRDRAPEPRPDDAAAS